MATKKKQAKANKTADQTRVADLAVHGGTKTVGPFAGRAKDKVGLDEFMALAETWDYSPKARQKIKKILAADRGGHNPHLTRYYNPRPSRVSMLEEYARKLFGAKHALGVNSGTSALNTAYVACGLGPGDEVIVPAHTFFATVAAVVTTKAIPVIAEIDNTLTIDPDDIEKKITPRTRAIVPVHMAGNCCDMDRIMKIARKHKLAVIEDNAQGCGGTYKGKFLGAIGDMGCFSLSSYKITGCGEAGLVLTDNEWLHIRAMNQHDTAACWRPDRFAKERKPGELFCGQNYRMSEMAGAVNLVQLKKTVAQAKRYNRNARRVLDRLEPFEITRPRRSNEPTGDVGYRIALFARDARHAVKLIEAFQAEGVPATGRGDSHSRDWHIYSYWEHILEQKTATPEGCPFTCPYHKGPLPAYEENMCPNTLDLMARAVYIGIDQWWTTADCRKVAEAINKVCLVMG